MQTTTFTDLVPTEADAAGVVGGAAFLDTTIDLVIVNVDVKID